MDFISVMSALLGWLIGITVIGILYLTPFIIRVVIVYVIVNLIGYVFALPIGLTIIQAAVIVLVIKLIKMIV